MKITDQTPYPLKPGTATICLGECFRCGTHGHSGIDCPIPEVDGARLSATKQHGEPSVTGLWDRLISHSIRLVELEEQGNVEGSL